MLGMFILAILPLLVILVGILKFRVSGAVMAVVGWLLAVILAVTVFRTPLAVTLGATAYGLLKGLGISVAVVFTMLMIFVMKETGALATISGAVKRVADTKEGQVLFIGIGFGSFVTSLGVVTPAMFPPLLMAMGFPPFSAVAIAVLGYNATTSFALLSIPLTIPAEAYGLDTRYLAYKICLFLPVLSTMLSFALLWIVGGMESIKKGAPDALLAGLSIGISCLVLVVLGAPLMILGVLAGLITMATLYALTLYRRKKSGYEFDGEPLDRKKTLKAMSPWIILITLAAMVSIPTLTRALEDLPGQLEVVGVFANLRVDFNIFSQAYTWILISLLLSIPILKPTKQQFRSAAKVWVKRIWSPFIAYSVYFCISYIMAFSAMSVINGTLTPTAGYSDYNMNAVVGSSLAAAFGAGFVWVATSLGLFGAVVGGSETGSNMLFFGIQREAMSGIGYNPGSNQTYTVLGSHAVSGGNASAITPAKINNAVATINGGTELESQVMRKHLSIAILLTFVTAIMTGIFVSLAI